MPSMNPIEEACRQNETRSTTEELGGRREDFHVLASVVPSNGPLGIARLFPPNQRIALIMGGFATTDPQLNFDAPLDHVETERDECMALLFDKRAQFEDFAAMQEELPNPPLIMVKTVAKIIGWDGNIVKKGLVGAFVNMRKRTRKPCFSFSDDLDLGAEKLNARFEFLDDFVIMKGFPIASDKLTSGIRL